jgi:hypothetical protein
VWSGAVAGDVEWYDFSSRIFDDRFTDGFLIRGDTVFTVGELFAASLIGWGADASPLLSVPGDILWLSCPLKVWNRRMGYEAHVTGHLGKAIMSNDRFDEELPTPLATESDDGRIQIPVDHGILLARWADGDLLPAGIADADGVVFASVNSPIPTGAVVFPEPPEGVLSHQDALTLLSRRRRETAAQKSSKPRRARVAIDVHPPDTDDDERWSLSSGNLAEVFGVSGGLEAEGILLQAVAEKDPELLEHVEGDSSAETVMVYVSNEEAARRLMAIAKSLA